MHVSFDCCSEPKATAQKSMKKIVCTVGLSRYKHHSFIQQCATRYSKYDLIKKSLIWIVSFTTFTLHPVPSPKWRLVCSLQNFLNGKTFISKEQINEDVENVCIVFYKEGIDMLSGRWSYIIVVNKLIQVCYLMKAK